MRFLALLFAVAVVGAGCGSRSGGLDKAGSRTVVLRLMVSDFLSSPTDQIAHAFARRVEAASGGAIRVTVDATDNPSLPGDFPERVIRSVRSGKADIAAVAARGWAGVGVTSLLPLETPMLISSDAAFDAVTKDSVAGDMLDGIRGAGLEPLALVPEGLRLLYGITRPLASPRDLEGLTIRIPPTKPGYAALEAVGAHPRWIPGFRAQDLAYAGKLPGVVTFGDPASLLAPGTYTANVPIYANGVTLAISDAAWKRLDAGQRRLLTEAALATRDEWARSRLTVAIVARKTCGLGYGVAIADRRALAAFRAAFAPVVSGLEADPANRRRITRIRRIDAPSSGPTVPSCTLAAAPKPVATGVGDQTVLDGAWRKVVTREQWATAGLPAIDWNTNGGLETMTFKHGAWVYHDDVVGHPPDGIGIFSIDGNVLTVVNTAFGDKPIKPFVLFRAHVARHGSELQVTLLGHDKFLATVFGGVWKKAG